LLFGLLAGAATPAAAPRRNGAEAATLREQLEAGLRARLRSDFVFIARVVQMVENDQLPLALVKSTFKWVRSRKRFERHLVPYFEEALRRRAAARGIRI
jgi:hypothetical protein